MLVLKTNNAVQLWIDLRNFIAQRTPCSQKTFTNSINLFLTFHHQQLNTKLAADFLIKCGTREVQEWIADMCRRKLAPRTIKTRVANLSSLFNKLLVRYEYRQALRIDIPKDDCAVRPTKTIPFELVSRRIVQALSCETFEGLQTAAAFALSFYCALRANEMLSLRYQDIQENDGVLCVYLERTKARKSALVPMAPEGAWIVRLYLKAVRDVYVMHSDSKIFPDLGYKGYRRRFRDAFHAGTHAARKACITRLLGQGISIEEVRKFARLASFKMVEVYNGQIDQLKDSPAFKLSFK